jgi:hydrogenase expression/formation protein
MIYDKEEKKSILPQFRESAYTKIKQEIGEETPELKLEMEKKIEKAATKALEKRQKIIDYIKKQNITNV